MIGFVRPVDTEVVEPYDIDDPTRIVSGTPTMSKNQVWTSEDGSVAHGVWQMTEGVIERFDGDETFVVVSGRATIEFTDRGETAELVPGSICVMHKGDPARITVHEVLRKVYALHGSH